MKEPHVRPEPIRHVVPLRCTTEGLRRLAELARAHDVHRAHVPFWTVDAGEVKVEFYLDKDWEISDRGKAGSRRDAEAQRNGDGLHHGDAENG